MREPGSIRAIVIDTNIFGANVEPNIKTIERWAAACDRHDAELWIPEIVVWELAQRVSHETDTILQAVKTHNARRQKWGFPIAEEPSLLDENDVQRRIEQAGAVIVPLSGDAAVAAVRDQVLQQGPASRKHNIKTGAADSGWIRSVIEYNDRDSSGLIVVTGDHVALTNTCTVLGVAVPRTAKNLYDIRELLEETVDATADQHELFAKAAADSFTGPDFTEADLVALADLGRRNWWNPDLGISADDLWEFQEANIVLFDVQVGEEIQFDAWSNSLTGDIRISVEVEEQYARQDQWGDQPEYLAITYNAWVSGAASLFADPGSDPEFIDLTNVLLEFDQSSVEPRGI